MFKSFPVHSLIPIACVVFLSACSTPPRGDVTMPPKAPPERIQSTIFSQHSETRDLPVKQTAQAIPEGITLKLKGREVDYEVLETVPDPGNRTVLVLAKPSTPYADVVSVLDTLHEMGFFVSLSAQK